MFILPSNSSSLLSREVHVMIKQLAAVALAAAAFAACEPNRDGITEPQGSFQRVAEREGDNVSGAVYTITNQVTGNAVAVFARGGDGTLTPAGSFGTGGTGRSEEHTSELQSPMY